jgi:hypothetical protein
LESGPLRPMIDGGTFEASTQPGAVLCAAKHDEGVCRLHSLT